MVVLKLGRCLLFAIGFAACLALIGCCTITQDSEEWQCVAKRLDKIDEFSQEWGRASISDLAIADNSLLNGKRTDFFDLQYTNPTSYYMDQARQNVQGTAALSVNEQFSGQISAQYSPAGGLTGISVSSPTNTPAPAPILPNPPPPPTNSTPTPVTNPAPPVATNSVPAWATNGVPPWLATLIAPWITNSVPPWITSPTGSGSTNPPPSGSTNPPPPTTSNSVPPTATMPTVPGVPPMVPIAAIQPSEKPQLAEGVVLKIGATDKETERILNYMSNPIDLPYNKKAYLAVMQVSVLPGWRTRHGYICEAQVNFSYAISQKGLENRCRTLGCRDWGFPIGTPDFIDSRRANIEEFRLPRNRAPSVIAAFPFAEAQILDSASSYQQQLNFLAQISGMIPQVPGLSAALQGAYNKLTQQGIATKNALPLVVPSSEGSDVTYRFDPELQALVNPSSASSGPGQVLEPSSFPALIVIICDADDLTTWDSIHANVTTRWIPMVHRNWLKKVFVDWWLHGFMVEQPFCEAEQLDNAAAFDVIDDQMREALNYRRDLPETSYAYQEVERRFENLKTVAMGHSIDSKLPLLRPLITDVYPSRFRQDYLPDRINIQGFYFKTPTSASSVSSVVLEGTNGEFHFGELCQNKGNAGTFTVYGDGHSIALGLTDGLNKRLLPGRYDLGVATAAGIAWRTDAVEVIAAPAPVVTALIAKPLHEYVTTNENITGKQDDSTTASLQPLNIFGSNFLVGDDSLRISIGGKLLAPRQYKVKNNERIAVYVSTETLGLEPGRYSLTVATSGGVTTSPNAVEIAYKATPVNENTPPPVPPLLTAVSPASFRLDQRPGMIEIFGHFFESSRVNLVDLGGVRLNVRTSTEQRIEAELSNVWLVATNYNVEVANEVGRAVLTNAIEVLPVPAPVVTTVFPAQIALSTNKDYTSQIAIAGNNFRVGDGSLRIAIGGVMVTNVAVVSSTDTRIAANDLSDNLMFVNVDSNTWEKIGVGKHEVAVITSGGEQILSNAVTIAQMSKGPATRVPVITDVSPKHGFLYSPTVLGISGSNFDGTIPCWSGARYVTVGGRMCEFKALSDTILAVTVPAWSKVGSTNDAAMATNKLDVVVFSINGVATLTNAVSFDLTLPSDAKYSSPLTPSEERIRKMFDAVFYAARVTGSNPVLQTSIKVTASAGDPDKSTDKVSVTLPNIAASIAIGSNAAPTTAAPVKPTPTPTNSPSSSP